ncbi:NAD dependent epimerase/dehydratase [Pseudomassariella vexata]|uniref:NAD dependent epimerase/dehydratase n=1 Tax=Pseudomassariella vexata TaxID=1141098 RepID=A0A1Y2DNE1_9PEZI|nr:NAD dependent epimerase/dehydratase [Pseudomassariella vexata]ORY60781.1 NAD dependent epimerase/dehydratase [Pseudomassariella vexata]
MVSEIKYVLVTGAAGFIGAHVVDTLLGRGFRVRGTTRSLSKGDAMIKARPQYSSQLDMVQIVDFENVGVFKAVIRDIDAVIHVASPFTYDTKDNEKELIIPAINGVKSILEASAGSKVQRIVITSSFASVIDINRRTPPYFTYTADDWNPLTYEEAADPSSSAVIAYRGSKKFSELEAWNFIKEKKPQFDIVTLCPPMTFGPVVHPVSKVEDLNESNAMLWKVASGANPMPVSRVPFWIDVRDLAQAHVEALLRPEVRNKRFTTTAPERFSYGLAARIMVDKFPWVKGQVMESVQPLDGSYGLDGETAAKCLGFSYRRFKETVEDLIEQVYEMSQSSV